MVTSLYSQYGFPQLYSRPSRPSILHNQIQPCTVQPPWLRPLYRQLTPHTVPTKCSLPLYKVPRSRHCTAIMASRYIQPAIVALASYNLVQSTLNVSPLYNKVWLPIVQRWGKPYSEHVLAVPGHEARSDLTHTSMQYVPGYGARAASSV